MGSNIELAQKLIIKDLSIDEGGPIFSKMDQLQYWLAGEIALLMDRDMQRLLNILYRIDVSEDKVKLAFISDEPAFQVAGLIIERELLKVETRKKYRDNI